MQIRKKKKGRGNNNNLPLADKLTKCEWPRPAAKVFQPDLKFFHVKISASIGAYCRACS